MALVPHDEVLGAWLAKESVRDVYLAENPDDAALLVDKAIAGCAADDAEAHRGPETPGQPGARVSSSAGVVAGARAAH